MKMEMQAHLQNIESRLREQEIQNQTKDKELQVHKDLYHNSNSPQNSETVTSHWSML